MNIVTRTVARLRPAVRAANPNTTNWGIGRLLKSNNPDVRAAAYRTAFDRIHTSPKLALQVLTGNFDRDQKSAAVYQLRQRMAFPGPFQVSGSNNFPLAITFTLPKFFELLARRSHEIIADVHRAWSDAEKKWEPRFLSQAQQQVYEMSNGLYKGGQDFPLVINSRVSQHLISYQAPGEKGAPGNSLYFLSACVIDGFQFDYTFSSKNPTELKPPSPPSSSVSDWASRELF